MSVYSNLSTSFSVGRIAIMHDIREGQVPGNVDPSMDHEVLLNELEPYNNDLIRYTDAKYQPYIDAYNEGKKPSRQIRTSYTEYVKAANEKLLKDATDKKARGIKSTTRKPTQLAYEYVVQFGNHENNSSKIMQGEAFGDYLVRMARNKEALKQVLNDMREKYPHCHILLATYHADEPDGTPHIHLLIQFDGEGYKIGLEHQLSVSKALECDGFARSATRRRDDQTKAMYAVNHWQKDVQDNVMTPVLERVMQAERDIVHDTLPHIPSYAFKAVANEKNKLRDEINQNHERIAKQKDAFEHNKKVLANQDAKIATKRVELQNTQDDISNAQDKLQSMQDDIAEGERIRGLAEYVAEAPALNAKKQLIGDGYTISADDLSRANEALQITAGLEQRDRELRRREKDLAARESKVNQLIADAKQQAAKIIQDAKDTSKKILASLDAIKRLVEKFPQMEVLLPDGSRSGAKLDKVVREMDDWQAKLSNTKGDGIIAYETKLHNYDAKQHRQKERSERTISSGVER